MSDQITPVFPVTIYKSRIPLAESLDYVRTVPHSRVTADNGYASDNQQILEEPELDFLKKQIMHHVDKYMASLRVSTKMEFFITCSWAILHDKGDESGEHFHSNSLISGVVYLNTDKYSGNLVFHRDWQTLFPQSLTPEFSDFTPFNCETIGVTPKPGDLYLFPSFLKHSVAPSESEIDRRCVAFNVFAKGKIDSRQDNMTHLEI